MLVCRTLSSVRSERAGVVALVRLETSFEYRNAAVRSAPGGSVFRVFVCREHHGSPASAADVEIEVLGEILIEVGHSADVYGVTNNYGEVLSGGVPGCLLPTQTRKPRVPRGDPQRRGRRRAARRPRKPTKPQMPKVVVRTGG